MLAIQQNDQSKSKTSNSTTQQRDTMNQQKNTKSKDMNQGQSSSSAALSSADREFIMKAADGGMAEVELGRLAVNKASNSDVKAFGQRMVDDHSKANDQLMQLAQTKGVTLPDWQAMAGTSMTQSDTTTTNPTSTSQTNQSNQTKQTKSDMHSTMSGKDHQMMMEHQKTIDKLSKLSGADFDKAYMNEMLKDHEKDVALFEKEANSGKDADVKSWATSTLPTLRDHLQMARDTAAKVGIKTAGAKTK
jgi:putative membrane protein